MRFVKYVLCVCVCCASYAGVREELFWRAGTLYAQKDFSQALDLYQAMEPKSEAIWHNIGACHAALGNDLQAIVSWRQAQVCAAPAKYDELERKIRALYQKMEKPAYADAFYVRRLVARILMRLPLFAAQLLFLAWLFFMACGRLRTRGQLLFGVCVALGLGFLLLMKYSSGVARYAVVMHEHTVLCAGPGDQYQALGEAPLGALCRVKSEEDTWMYVDAHDFRGWCRRAALTQINGV